MNVLETGNASAMDSRNGRSTYFSSLPATPLTALPPTFGLCKHPPLPLRGFILSPIGDEQQIGAIPEDVERVTPLVFRR